MLSRGDILLLLNEPGVGGAGRAGAGRGRSPAPGGWARIVIEVEDLDAELACMSAAEVSIRGDVVEGRGGRQVMVDDPAGNAVELFEPSRSG